MKSMVRSLALEVAAGKNGVILPPPAKMRHFGREMLCAEALRDKPLLFPDSQGTGNPWEGQGTRDPLGSAQMAQTKG